MSDFVFALGLGYLAAALLPGGVTHLARPGEFRDLVRAHGLVPRHRALAVVLLVGLMEVVIGAVALMTLAGVEAVPAPGLFGVTVALGLAFVLYVRRLLRRPDVGVGCGCGPLASPLTPAALLPGAALAIVSAAALLGAAVELVGGSVDVFAALWGVTLAVLVMLVPASMPAVELERSG